MSGESAGCNASGKAAGDALVIVHCNKRPISGVSYRQLAASTGDKTIPGLHQTISKLAALRGRLAPAASGDRLGTLANFGSNPGRLEARTYVPEGLRRNAPLVVVLHGCTQNAAGYDRSAGWSTAADQHGFALLFPEQQRSNNPNLCFNWFSPEDASRGRGEVLSIRQMIAAMQARHGCDPARIFVTGLSAGGAMAAAMLATYPELFAGGSVIAGLPFGVARSVPEAFESMRGQHNDSPAALGKLVRGASSHKGPWPSLSVWHGTDDATVEPSNAQALVDQWRVVHGAPESASRTELVEGFEHRVWQDRAGREVIEEYRIAGMGHGTPLDPSEENGEETGPFMLDAGISSTAHSLAFWGIAEVAPRAEQQTDRRVEPASARPATNVGPAPASAGPSPVSGVKKTIEDALRSAGLLR